MASSLTFTVIFSIRAENGIRIAWEWYEERQQGLGDRFISELMNKVEQVEKNPEKYSVKVKSFRETALKTFPFLVIYSIAKRVRQIRIVSVYHTSLDPKKKYK